MSKMCGTCTGSFGFSLRSLSRICDATGSKPRCTETADDASTTIKG
jgi:hypothetical protein